MTFTRAQTSYSDAYAKGAAALPIVIILGILILVVGIELSSSSISELVIALGQKKTSQALLYAEDGAKDALIRIARNKKYSCPTSNCYSISFGTNGCSASSACSDISVTAGVGSVTDPKIITSKGVVNTVTRKVQVNVIFDDSQNGEIATTTWSEVLN